MKNFIFNKELGLVILLSIILFFLFSFPLKYLCLLCGTPYLFLLVLSGLISCVNSIVYKAFKGINRNVNIFELIYIFFLSISLIFITGIIGYPVIGYLISICEVLSIISLKDTFYFLFNCIFSEPESLFMGDISSDQIYDKPGKKDKSFLVNNADASGESGIPLYLAAESADNSNTGGVSW